MASGFSRKSAAFAAITLLTSLTLAAQAPAPGATVDPPDFRYSRAIAPGPEALVVLPLDAAVLAHSRGPAAAFADVRVVNRENRQMQYVLERTDDRLEIDVPFRPATSVPLALASAPGHNRSTYRIELPYAGLPDGWLVIETSAARFSRPVQLAVERPPDRHHRDRWVQVFEARHWDGGTTNLPMPIPLEQAAAESNVVLLTLDEQDNAPLPLTAVRVRLPRWRIWFYRPEGEPLRLLYGNPATSAPRYDLDLSRATVLRSPAVEISAGPEPVKKETAAIVSPRVFWGFLIAAVLVLLALIARLATSRTSGGPPPPSAPAP